MRWIVFSLLLALTACQPKESSTLESIELRLIHTVGRVAIGDRAHMTFEPVHGADWFLLVPANATAAMFAEAGLGKAIDPIPPELLGKPEPLMATIDGKKVEVKELPLAFQVTKVMAKRGKNTHGLRLVRLMGTNRNHQIEAID